MSDAGAILIVIGAIFCLLAAIGVVRFPDFFTRVHAASKAGVLGAGVIFIGVALTSMDVGTNVRMIIGVIFIVLTTPLAAHLLARAAFTSGPGPKVVDNQAPDKSDAI